ncbi:MAG: FAD-dependent oxidoreductase [Anaerococcus hydrogenalis]|nr:FAD-dependent oxidoreductase [Anaerococcus hydrogenalis]
MLDNKLKDQLKAYLKMLKSNVTIGLSLNEDENSKKLKSFIEEVESLSDKIKIEEEILNFTPAFSLNGEFEHGKIVFAGIPLGHEFESFVLALLQVGGIEPKISNEEKERIRSIKEKRNFETIVSLSCHNCPEVVQAFNIMAVLNKNISHTMIEGSINQDICDKRDVMAVPAIFEDGEFLDGGKKTMASLLDLVAEKVQKDLSNFKDYDILIVGAGPSSTTAAIYGARKGLKVAIVADEFGGQVNETLDIENITGILKTEGPKYMLSVKNQVENLGVDIIEGVKAVDFEKKDDEFNIILEDGAKINSKSLIFATGTRWRLLGIDGEEKFKNKGVAFCTHCDGPLFKGEFLPELKADKILQTKLESFQNVKVISSAQTTKLLGDKKLTGLKYIDRNTKEEKTIDLDGVFIQIGQIPNTEWLEGKIKLTDRGEIEVEKDGSTNIEGIFAAGDAINSLYKQIIIAAGSGATAALSAFNYLIRK